MPHLPPVVISGGSVTLKFPVDEVDAKGKVVQTFFDKAKQKIETYPEDGDKLARKQTDNKTNSHKAKRYTQQSFKTTKEADAYIYMVEIYGEDDDETFEFRPKDGKCSVKVYFATEDEDEEVRGLMNDRRWQNTVKRMLAEGKL